MGRLYEWAHDLRAKHEDFTRLGLDVAEVKDLLIALTGAVEQVSGAGVGPGNLDPPKRVVGAPEDGPGVAVTAPAAEDAMPEPPVSSDASTETAAADAAAAPATEKDQVVALVSQALEDPTLLEQVKGFLHMFGVRQG